MEISQLFLCTQEDRALQVVSEVVDRYRFSGAQKHLFKVLREFHIATLDFRGSCMECLIFIYLFIIITSLTAVPSEKKQYGQ